jgi:hypothetical protein
MVFKNNLRNGTTANISQSMGNIFTSDDPTKVDSDHDGVSDRDEIIYGTDPFNKDTDGDKYIDGEEIIAGTDPIDANDNSKNRANGTSKGSLSLISQTANLTDRLMNMGLASMIDDSGNINSSSITEGKFADILTSINTEAVLNLSAVAISDKDIKITEDNSPQTVSKYIHTVSAIIEEGIFNPSGMMITGTAEDIVGLSEKNYYQSKYDSLKIIEVPSSWKDVHKSVLSDLQVLANCTKALTSTAINSDPIKAGFALNQLQNAFLSLNSILTQASNLAKKQNITLNDSVFEMLQISSTNLTTPTPIP